MEPTILIATAALIVSAINSAFAVKAYKKNRRLEFLQRKDRLSQKISDLNDANAAAHLISAKFAIRALKNAALLAPDSPAERKAAMTGRLTEIHAGIENGILAWDGTVASLRLTCRRLTSPGDAPEVERMIALIDGSIDKLKECNDGLSSALEVLEASGDILETALTKLEQQYGQIHFDTEMMRRTGGLLLAEVKKLREPKK